MLKVQKYIKDKKAEELQGKYIIGGFVFGAISFVGFSAGSFGTGFWTMLISMASFFIAAKIKTKKTYGGSIYK